MAIKSVSIAAKECGVTSVAIYQAIERGDIKARDVSDGVGGKRVGVPDLQIAAYQKLLASRPKRGPKVVSPRVKAELRRNGKKR